MKAGPELGNLTYEDALALPMLYGYVWLREWSGELRSLEMPSSNLVTATR